MEGSSSGIGVLVGALQGYLGGLVDLIGFGLPIDSPSLGRFLSLAKANLQAPWLGSWVFITLTLLLTLLIFIG